MNWWRCAFVHSISSNAVRITAVCILAFRFHQATGQYYQPINDPELKMGIPNHGVAVGDEVSINCTVKAPANSAVNVTALYLNAQDESRTSETAVVEAKVEKEGGKALLTSGTKGDSASGSVEEMFVVLTLKAVTCANRTFNCWASYRYKHDPNTPIGIRSKSVSLLVQRPPSKMTLTPSVEPRLVEVNVLLSLRCVAEFRTYKRNPTREWRWEFREKWVSGWTSYEDQALITHSSGGYTDCRNVYSEVSVLFLIVQKQDFRRVYRCYYIERGVHFDNMSAHYYFRPVSTTTTYVYSDYSTATLLIVVCGVIFGVILLIVAIGVSMLLLAHNNRSAEELAHDRRRSNPKKKGGYEMQGTGEASSPTATHSTSNTNDSLAGDSQSYGTLGNIMHRVTEDSENESEQTEQSDVSSHRK